MERVNQYSFYLFGKTLKELERFQKNEDVQRGDIFIPLMNAKNAIAGLINGDPIPLGISRASAEKLSKHLEKLWDDNFTEADDKGKKLIRFPEDGDSPISYYLISFACDSLKEFETVFREEMREAATYFVQKHGIYNTPDLVDKADQTFPDEVKEHIPEKAKKEWKAAGRCLAFNLLSASGFHVARAVESTLEIYYQLFSGKEGQTLAGWKDYYLALDKIRKENIIDCLPNEKTLLELDQMRDDYRNPLMHPRVVLTEADAKMLFNNGESLIIAMAQEIKGVKENGAIQTVMPTLIDATAKMKANDG